MCSNGNLVCDYYCEVGVRENLVRIKPRARERHGSSRVPAADALLSGTFEPSVLLRHPQADRGRHAFTNEVAQFVFPHGARLVTRAHAAANAIPVVTSFVLTASDKSRLYGACIVWYEELPPPVVAACLYEREHGAASLDELRHRPPPPPAVHAPEAICLLASAPVFSARALIRARDARSPDIPRGAPCRRPH